MITLKLRHAVALSVSVLGPFLTGAVNDRPVRSTEEDGGPESVVAVDRAAFETVRSEPEEAAAASADWLPHTVSIGENASSFAGFVTHRLDKRWKAQAYVVTGPDITSADYGLGGGLSFAF